MWLLACIPPLIRETKYCPVLAACCERLCDAIAIGTAWFYEKRVSNELARILLFRPGLLGHAEPVDGPIGRRYRLPRECTQIHVGTKDLPSMLPGRQNPAVDLNICILVSMRTLGKTCFAFQTSWCAYSATWAIEVIRTTSLWCRRSSHLRPSFLATRRRKVLSTSLRLIQPIEMQEACGFGLD